MVDCSCFVFRNACKMRIQFVCMIVELLQQSETFFRNGNIHQAAVILAYHFFNKFFFQQPVDDPAGVAHFIEHALAYL